jgi:ankyrin repeat protein
VFQDLRPYVCTFEDCPQASHLFSGRHEWFHHEQNYIDESGFVVKCSKAFSSDDRFRQHLLQHRDRFTREQLDIMVDRGSRAMEEKQKCRLCNEDHKPKQFMRHLGRHLEQIALFILPGAVEDEAGEEEESDSDDNGDDEIYLPNKNEATKSIDAPSGSYFPQWNNLGIGKLFKSQFTAAQTFLTTGIGINNFYDDGYTHLHKATEADDLEWASLLLDSGADPNARIKDVLQRQPIYIAAINGKKEAMQLLLLRKEVDLNSKDKSNLGSTALELACDIGHGSVARLLLMQDGIDIKNSPVALVKACEKGHEDIVELLLRQTDINPNAQALGAQQSRRWTPFRVACWKGNESIVKIPLSHKDIEVNKKSDTNYYGRNTALYIASYSYIRNNDCIIRELLERKDIDINAKRDHERTALIGASMLRNVTAVTLLLGRHDLDINAKDDKGKTALDYARQKKYWDIVELLEGVVQADLVKSINWIRERGAHDTSEDMDWYRGRA